MDKQARKFTVFVMPVGDAYQTFFPFYPDCVTVGKTPTEALAKAKEAIELCMEGEAERGGDPVLAGAYATHVVVGEIEAEVPISLIEREQAYERGDKPES